MWPQPPRTADPRTAPPGSTRCRDGRRRRTGRRRGDRSLRGERRPLARLAVRDAIRGDVLPPVDGRSPPPAQLGAGVVLDVGADSARHRRGDEVPARRAHTSGATLLITATFSTGPCPVPSSTTSLASIGASSRRSTPSDRLRRDLGEVEQPCGRRAFGGDDDGGAVDLVAALERDRWADVDPTRAARWIAGQLAASCSGIACIPAAGTAESPSASIRKMTSNIRRLSPSSGSSWMPPTSGRKKRSMIVSENPAPTEHGRADVVPCSSRTGCMRRSRCRSRAIRALSNSEPIGAVTVPRRRRSPKRVGDHGAPPVAPHERTGVEGPQIERRHVELAVHLGVGGERDLEAAVEGVAVDVVGAHAPSDAVARLVDLTGCPPRCRGTAHESPARPAPTTATAQRFSTPRAAQFRDRRGRT